MNLRIDLNEPRIREKVTSNRFGLLVSNEWKRLIDPYTPRDTGTLMQDATLRPFEIFYDQKYATRVYYGRNFKFKKINPSSTYEWDIKASQSGQLNKLYRTLNNALQSGRF